MTAARTVPHPRRVGRTPKDSKWYATPESKRHRRHVSVTLAPADRARLDELAKEHRAPKGQIVAAALAVFAGMSDENRARALRAAG